MIKPYAIYKKAIKGKVSGVTIDRRGETVEFLLVGNPSNPNDDVDEMVVELFSQEDEKWFKRRNKAALSEGYLIKIEGEIPDIDTVNAVSDGELKDLLRGSYKTMEKKVNEFTSSIPIRRLLEFAVEANKPVKTIQFLTEKISALEGDSSMPLRIQTDDGSVGV